ncbi:ABC transporter substrate-binding protein [Corynebacterium sp. SCR221107]|uniref:taurine ABC transporter substrate-binding protein n=1 Tax=Corynebacterium sp. SCR221107 TaxID=3017361 RepID=UPI0022EC2152|nr:ABC transporter substrate-binding protein [Corynebacterium sp. SCR221107]WBT08796.1 ABC transporter substrate-binding protein [Corynebacterium sp. SCR221107]
MVNFKRVSKNYFALAGILTLGLPLSACVGQAASQSQASSETTCPVAVNEAEGSVRIAYLGSPAQDLYVYDQGLLDACLPNVKAEWTRYPTGQDIIQGFAANSVDLGNLGSTPTTKTLSDALNLDVFVPRVNAVIGETEALVAKNATSVAELKGKKIAVPFSSTSHYSLLKVLEAAGLDPKTDVTITNISPDKLPAAWASDDIEAAYVWDPTLQVLKENSNVLVTSEQVANDGAPTFNNALVSRAWSKDNSSILDTWLELQDWVTQKAINGDADYVESVAAASGMKLEDAQRQVKGQKYVPASEQPEQLKTLGEALHSTAEFLVEQGEIPAAHDQAHYVGATTEYGFYK